MHATYGQRGEASMRAAGSKRQEFVNRQRKLPRATGINREFHSFLFGRLWDLHVIIICDRFHICNDFYHEI